MSESGATPPLRIRNLNYAGFQLFIGLVLGPLLIGMAVFMVVLMAVFDEPKDKSGKVNWIRMSFLIVPSFAGGAICLYHGFTAPVFWLELGEQIRYRKPTGIHIREWSSVREIRVEDEVSRFKLIPIGSHRILVIKLSSGGTLRVKVDCSCEAQIPQLAADKGITVQF